MESITNGSSRSGACRLSNEAEQRNNETGRVRPVVRQKELKPETPKRNTNVEETGMTLRTRLAKNCLDGTTKMMSSGDCCSSSGGDDGQHSSETQCRKERCAKRQKRENVRDKDVESSCGSAKKSKMSIKEMAGLDVCVADERFSVGGVTSRSLKCGIKSERKVMQTINGSKRAVHENRKMESSSKVDGQKSGANQLAMLCQLPSKLGMFAETPKTLTENKFCLSFGCPSVPVPHQRQNKDMLHLLNQTMFGMRGGIHGKKIVLRSVSDRISDFHLVRTLSPFDRRCTAMAWHPFNPNLVVVGSKGGDIILSDLENVNRDVFIQGCGLGGVIQAMKFLPETASSLRLLTASMDGTVVITDLATEEVVTTFINTAHLIHQFWYCSCDVDPRCNMVVHGDSLGNAVLQTLDGTRIWSHKLHRNKINHVEFHRKHEWLLSSASTDQYVCLWDVRMLKNQDSYIARLKHEKGVNSAYFSSTDGTRLLTTDQHHELRVYECGAWNLEQTIVHPHRFYQHLTPMKASWHPLEDLIICGRYPDKTLPGYENNDERGIDFIDPFSTEIICHLHDSFADGIVTLAQFNNIGSTLAATMGYTILIWQKDITLEKENQSKKVDRPHSFKASNDITTSSSNSNPLPRSKTKLSKTSKNKQKG